MNEFLNFIFPIYFLNARSYLGIANRFIKKFECNAMSSLATLGMGREWGGASLGVGYAFQHRGVSDSNPLLFSSNDFPPHCIISHRCKYVSGWEVLFRCGIKCAVKDRVKRLLRQRSKANGYLLTEG
jgi:hypothetical protein